MHELGSGKYAPADELVDRADADAQPRRGLLGADRFGPRWRGVGGGVPEPLSKLAHADSRPGLPVGGFASHPVHCHRNLAIRPLTAELADDLHRAGVAIRWVAPSAGARDAQLGMTTAVPVDRHDRLVGQVIAVEYNFPDQDVDNALLCSGVRAWRVPGGRQVVGERQQRCAIGLWAPRDSVIVPGDAVLETGDAF